MLMKPFSLRGMGIALVTPFKADYSVDYDALRRLVEMQIAGGASYLVVLATTSEAVTLDCEERHKVARFVVDCAGGRIPLVLGMSDNCTSRLAKHLTEVDLSGYSAILTVVPFYNKPSQEGIYQHFRAVAEASPLPVVLYNVPSRTGKNMEAATTLRLAHDFPGKVIGIKEASGSLEQVGDILQGRPEGFQVVSGDDSLTRSMIGLGAEGVISVVGNALPRLFATMVSLAMENADDERAQAIDVALQPLDKALFADGNPSGIKCLLNLMGVAEDVQRLPLVPVGFTTRLAIKEAYERLDVAMLLS